jgi:hypothetical protein
VALAAVSCSAISRKAAGLRGKVREKTNLIRSNPRKIVGLPFGYSNNTLHRKIADHGRGLSRHGFELSPKSNLRFDKSIRVFAQPGKV